MKNETNFLVLCILQSFIAIAIRMCISLNSYSGMLWNSIVRISSDPATFLFFIWILIYRVGVRTMCHTKSWRFSGTVEYALQVLPLLTTFKLNLKLCMSQSHLPSLIPESFFCMLIPYLLKNFHFLLKFLLFSQRYPVLLTF